MISLCSLGPWFNALRIRRLAVCWGRLQPAHRCPVGILKLPMLGVFNYRNKQKLQTRAIRPGEPLLIISRSPPGRYPASGAQHWLWIGKVTPQAEQNSLARPKDPIQVTEVGEGQSRTPLALKIKVGIKHSDRASYIIWGTQYKRTIQGSLFKKQEKSAIKDTKI